MPFLRRLKWISHLSVIFFASNLLALCDLEERIQPFVLDTKKIVVPGYPHAFNPSIVRWNGSLLMSFRYIAPTAMQARSIAELYGYVSRIGLVWLDEEFNPIGEAQLIDVAFPDQPMQGREEDGRLVAAEGRLYLVYSDNKEADFSDAGFRVYMLELFYDGERFITGMHRGLKDFEGENPHRREKNWTPFECDGKLNFAYTINPHMILQPIPGSDSCRTVARTYAELSWAWGDPRGGTPALRISESRYLSFFHSLIPLSTVHSAGADIDHYVMGAYTFSAVPPHQVLEMSPEPIIGKNFYHGIPYKYYWRPVVVVFPCGFIFDKNFFWVFYGRQDHEIWAVKIDKNALLESLEPVHSNSL